MLIFSESHLEQSYPEQSQFEQSVFAQLKRLNTTEKVKDASARTKKV